MSLTHTSLHPLKNRYEPYLDQSLAKTQGSAPSLSALCMDLRVPVQRFVPTLPHLCAKRDTHLVRLTLTYGLKPIPDQTTTNMYYLTCCLTIDHRRLDTALKLSDQTVVQDDNRTYEKRTTIGWQLCCQWKDGSTLNNHDHTMSAVSRCLARDPRRLINLTLQLRFPSCHPTLLILDEAAIHIIGYF